MLGDSSAVDIGVEEHWNAKPVLEIADQIGVRPPWFWRRSDLPKINSFWIKREGAKTGDRQRLQSSTLVYALLKKAGCLIQSFRRSRCRDADAPNERSIQVGYAAVKLSSAGLDATD
jgi:hypothetical protein